MGKVILQVGDQTGIENSRHAHQSGRKPDGNIKEGFCPRELQLRRKMKMAAHGTLLGSKFFKNDSRPSQNWILSIPAVTSFFRSSKAWVTSATPETEERPLLSIKKRVCFQ